MPTREERNAYMREWHKANRDRVNAERRAARVENGDRIRQYMKEWRAANKDKNAAINQRYYAANQDKLKDKAKTWYRENPERAKETRKAYYEEHKDEIYAQVKQKNLADPAAYKEKKRRDYERHEQAYKDRAKRWREANPERAKTNRDAWKEANWGLVLAHSAAQRAAKLQRIPLWADLDAIDRFYTVCPEGYHVDHYYPLRGKYVSGLHTLDNLRYLPAVENLRKSNKMPEEIPCHSTTTKLKSPSRTASP